MIKLGPQLVSEKKCMFYDKNFLRITQKIQKLRIFLQNIFCLFLYDFQATSLHKEVLKNSVRTSPGTQEAFLKI